MVIGARHAQRGAGFLALLIVTALMSAAAAAGVTLQSTAMQREREAQLLWAGAQIQRALLSYAQTAPDELRKHPRTLEDLLLDTRGAAPRRHLRRVYEDPMTPDGRWMLVRDEAGRIVGVHSHSTRAPLKRSAFAADQSHFAKAKTHAQWVFGTPLAIDKGSHRGPPATRAPNSTDPPGDVSTTRLDDDARMDAGEARSALEQ